MGKIDAIDEAINKANANYKVFEEEHTEDVAGYNSVIGEIESSKNKLAELDTIYEDIMYEYQDENVLTYFQKYYDEALRVEQEFVNEPRYKELKEIVAEGDKEVAEYKEELQKMYERGETYSEKYDAEWWQLESWIDYNRREARAEFAELEDVHGTYLQSLEESRSQLEWQIELTHQKEETEIEMAQINEKMDSLKQNEGYIIVASVKETKDIFVKAANEYKEKLAIKQAAESIVERADIAYARTAAAYKETKNLINAYRSTYSGRQNPTVNQMLVDVIDIEKNSNSIEDIVSQTTDMVRDNNFNRQLAQEQMDKVTANVTEIKEKESAVDRNYKQINSEVEDAKVGFNDYAGDGQYADFVKRCDQADNVLDKISVLSDGIDSANNNHAIFIEEHGEDIEQYEDLIKEIAETEKQIGELQWNISNEQSWYEHFKEDREWYDYYTGDDFKNKIKQYEDEIAKEQAILDAMSPYEADYSYVDRLRNKMESELSEVGYFMDYAKITYIYDGAWEGDEDDILGAITFSLNKSLERISELTKDVDNLNLRIDNIKSSDTYILVSSEKEKYDAVVGVASKYKDALAASAEADVIRSRANNALDKALESRMQLEQLLKEYDVVASDENVPSEDLKIVVSKVKTILDENPDIVEKLSSLKTNEKAINIVRNIYSNVTMSTINKVAKQLVSFDINAAILNNYLDMFMDWINQ